jgi:hypothetical protein
VIAAFGDLQIGEVAWGKPEARGVVLGDITGPHVDFDNRDVRNGNRG